MKKILMTGGGTAGHVTPNIAMLSKLKKMGYEIHYAGTIDGIEKQLIENEGIAYHAVSAGKLRRYIDLKNLTDVFKVMRGFTDSIGVIRKVKPDIVFSKGGFVSCPVVWAAWINRIPAVVHESDYTPGLANKLSIPFAKRICFTFPETEKYLPQGKGTLTGIPVREKLFTGNAAEGIKLCGFSDKKPVIMVIGGSQGSGVLNTIIRASLKILLNKYQVCHICGKGNLDKELSNIQGYKQFEYVNEEQPHIFAMADVVVSRAGATVIFELLALKKPNLLIPLSKKASRGDQILNANSFKKQGYSEVLEEENLNTRSLLDNINDVYNNKETYIRTMNSSSIGNGVEGVVKVIEQYRKKR
ncbi:MAG: murG [Clostridiales bacterium]|jgi:UDP-N-acetylglucosamine--N-acetylmuramyl-(pentapeptide) pyrophosphoryl-undecaprenol N-acetylglucosamine transferase|nr:murG [Clostridiales bacterium]